MEAKYVPIDPKDAVGVAYDMGKKAGIKEAVDWFLPHSRSGTWIKFDISEEELKAKLKEWGIKPVKET